MHSSGGEVREKCMGYESKYNIRNVSVLRHLSMILYIVLKSLKILIQNVDESSSSLLFLEQF